MKVVTGIIIDLLICFCGFGLGYKKGYKDAEDSGKEKE